MQANSIQIDSFISQWFPRDPEVWRDYIAPRGAHKENLLADLKVPMGSYMTDEEVKYFKDTFAESGWTAPLSWYRATVRGYRSPDDASTLARLAYCTFVLADGMRCSEIPPERAFPPVEAPIFFGATKKDYICIPEFGYAVMRSEAMKNHRVTCKEFDSDHWLLFTHADEVTRELLAWIESFAQ